MRQSIVRSLLVLAPVALTLSAPLLLAQENSAPPSTPAEPAKERVDDLGRRVAPEGTTVLAFKNVSVDQVLPFLVESTGKVVLPQPDVLTRRITIVNDKPIPRARALDLVVMALQQAGIAVVETPDLVLLRDLAEVNRQDVPVLGPNQSVLERTDLGTMFQKVYAFHHSSVENIGDIIKDTLPDFAKYFVDVDSNQVVVMGNVALLQRLERLFNSLDQPSATALEVRTFQLRYSDATQIAANIKELFGSDANANNRQGGNQPGGQGGGGGGIVFFGGGGNNNNRRNRGGNNNNNDGTTAGNTENLRVTANTQQNSITVLAEPAVLEQIASQIANSWDKPLPEEAVIPRTYELKNSDPVKVKDLLEGLFGAGSSSGGGNNNTSSQGGTRLYGQFSFQAIPEASRLVVLSKSPDHLSVIDKIIEDLDQPQTAGLPKIVELKHATADELAEQLNALLSQEGTLAQINRVETGLSSDDSAASPFASDSDSTTSQNQNQNSSPQTMTFWWQRARPPTETAGASNLVSKIRIVPVWRQNALMILSPPEYTNALASIIEQLDRPGRQVLLMAVIAAVTLDDETALGLRFSSLPITPTNPDNAVSIGSGTGNDTFTGTKNNLLPGLFDASVLDVGVNLNVLLQALAQKTAVNILSEPRIYTSDNQEAEFFDGQDIPFITDSQTTDQGNVVQSFDYRAVGLQLRVRPRITPKREVDLRINLELSSIQPQQTLFGGFIVDRRETTTHLIVQNGQTVVLSGILKAEDSDIKRKIPLLGDIPLIGGIFRSTEKVQSRTEVVAFITPIVVENPEEADEINAQDRERLHELQDELRPPPVPAKGDSKNDAKAETKAEEIEKIK